MKGSIDIVTLVIVMVPMSIFLIIGGQRLSKAAIDTSLQSSYDVGTEKFKSQNKIYQILHSRETVSDEPLYKKIVRLPVASNPDSLNSSIESQAHDLLSRDTENYYEFIVQYPDGDQLKASTWTDPSTSSTMSLSPNPNTRERAEIHLPSPREGFVEVSIRVLS